MMADNLVRLFEGEEELSIALADYVAQLSDAAVNERGAFAIALSGGPLVRLLGKLTKSPYLKTVDWSKWHVFWAEEKLVVPSRKHESNYKQAKIEFLSKVPILPAQINPLSQTGSAESAAEEYEFSIRQLVRNRTVDVSVRSDCPRFDLVLLVLGPDGRISSLNLDQTGPGEETLWVRPVVTSGAEADSVTLSVPVINSSANAAIIVTGKAVSLMHAARAGAASSSSPAKPNSILTKDVVWFVDATAASTSDSSNPVDVAGRMTEI